MKKCFCIIPFNFSNYFPDFKNLEIFSVLSKLGFFENLLFNRKAHSTLTNAGLLAKVLKAAKPLKVLPKELQGLILTSMWIRL